jgi:hypothetical protein
MASKKHITSAEIHIEEHYTYQLSLGLLPSMSLEQQEGHVRVIIPCDGTLKYTDQQLLRDIGTGRSEIALGTVMIALPDTTHPAINLNIQMPTKLEGQSITEWMRSGKNLQWKGSYPVQLPSQSLLSVTGEITDDINGDRILQRIQKMLSGSPENFTSDLYLQLKIWVSDFMSGSRWLKQKKDVEDLLLQTDSATLVRLPHADDQNELQRHLIELANRGGGLLLIGVDKQGQAIGPAENELPMYAEHVSLALVQAALNCEPTIPFDSEPEIVAAFNGRLVARVDVPEVTRNTQFKKKSSLWGGIQSGVSQVMVNSCFEIQNYHSTFDDINQFISTLSRDSFVRIDASNATIDQIGQTISGLINIYSGNPTNQIEPQIVFVNLPEAFAQNDTLVHNQAQRGCLSRLTTPGTHNTPGAGSMRTFQDRLNTALNRCVSIPNKVTLEVITMRKADERVGVLRLNQITSPVLYEGQGFEWRHNRLYPLTGLDLMKRYITSVRYYKDRVNLRKSVRVTYGELTVPVQPPAGIPDRVRQDDSVNLSLRPDQAYYDTQTHALVWKSVELHHDRDTNGWFSWLVAPLKYALVDPNELSTQQHTVQSNSKQQLTGRFSLCFDGVLASNAQPDVTEAPDTLPLRHPLIDKKTYIHVNFTADPQYLFKHRRHASSLRFQLPNITLGDQNSVAQSQILDGIYKIVWQIFSDLGFRLLESQQHSQVTSFRLSGWRSKGFYDIELIAGISWKDTHVTREFRYLQRTDNKAITVATLDILVMLLGSGNNIARELAMVHTDMHHLMNTRLQFLSTE